MKIAKKQTKEVTRYLLTWLDTNGRWYRYGPHGGTRNKDRATRFISPEGALATQQVCGLEYMVQPVTEEVDVESETLELRLERPEYGDKSHALVAYRNGKRAFCGNILFIREEDGLFSFEGADGIGEGLVHPSNLRREKLVLDK